MDYHLAGRFNELNFAINTDSDLPGYPRYLAIKVLIRLAVKQINYMEIYI